MDGHEAHNETASSSSDAINLSHSGLLASHLYFGSWLFILGIWWSLAVLKSYFTKSSVSKVSADLSSSGACRSIKCKLIEGIFKFVVCLIGIGVEYQTVAHLGRPSNYTYTTIYTSFILAAIVDIIIGFKVVLPDGIDFAAHAVSFLNLGLLARSQATGHMHLTVATRLLTSYVAFFNGICLLFEAGHPKISFIKLLRVGGVLTQAVWFWQSGIVLDSYFAERWEETYHPNLMFITIAFVWNMCGVTLFVTLLYFISGRCYGTNQVSAIRNKISVRDLDSANQYSPINSHVDKEQDESVEL